MTAPAENFEGQNVSPRPQPLFIPNLIGLKKESELFNHSVMNVQTTSIYAQVEG